MGVTSAPTTKRQDTRTAKLRGAATQRAVAAHLAVNGWPYATDAGAGRTGCDILGTPGLAFEIKARKDLNPTGWLKQAAKGDNGIPLCVFRPIGCGTVANGGVGRWPVLMYLDDVLALLRAAGYGDPPDQAAAS